MTLKSIKRDACGYKDGHFITVQRVVSWQVLYADGVELCRCTTKRGALAVIEALCRPEPTV